jgi:signal transduction histidine kinase
VVITSRRFVVGKWQPRTVDACVVAAVLAAALVGGLDGIRPWAIASRVLAAACLAFRRRWPVPVWAFATVAALAALALGPSTYLVVLAPVTALYYVATVRQGLVTKFAGISSVGAGLLAIYLGQIDVTAWLAYVLAAVVTVACWLVGDNVRVRRAYVAELEASAAKAEAGRAAELNRAAAYERERIARELHDVVVHHVSVIAIQAGAARMVAETGDGAAAPVKAWRAVEETARLALTELRQLLGTLRHEGDPPSLTPQPGLRQLGQLLEEVHAAGLPVRSEVVGIPDQLPPALDLSAYRIIQEALTNIMKHEGRAPALVRLCCRGGAVEVEVTNEAGGLGATGTPEGPGRGLIGMRERAEVLGGSLHAGPCANGGFRVLALLPLDGSVS